MSRLPVGITAAVSPSLDEILRRDAAFHLGARDRYQYDVADAVRRGLDAMGASFLCLNPGTQTILAPRDLAQCYTLRDRTLSCREDAEIYKYARMLKTINRQMPFLRDDLYYAYDFRDERNTDYALKFQTRLPVPVMQYHRRRSLSAVIVPLANYHNCPSWNIPLINDATAFRQKRPIAFWRGALSGVIETRLGRKWTGKLFRGSEFTDQERSQLLRQSARFIVCSDHLDDPMVDAKLIIKTDSEFTTSESSMLEKLSGPSVKRETHLAYKYLLALDGYDGPSNFYWMLNSNSLILRQESEWEMFGDCYFQPWVHFVPLAQDCSDLSEKIEWCESHQAECERMIENAHAAWALLFDASFAETREKYNLELLSSWMKDAG